MKRGCLCDNWKSGCFLLLVMFDWRTSSRRVKSRWWRQSGKNQVSSNDNSVVSLCQTYYMKSSKKRWPQFLSFNFLICFNILVFIQVSGKHRKTFIKQNRNISIIVVDTTLFRGYFLKCIPFSRNYSKDFLNQILLEKPSHYTG